jgi:oligoribonuclease
MNDRPAHSRDTIRDTRLVFIDLETTGASPTRDVVLEVGAAVVSVDLDVCKPFVEVPASRHAPASVFSAVVDYGDQVDHVLSVCPDKVRAMHEASGLVADMRRADLVTPIAEIETNLVAWLIDGHGFAPGGITIAGYSIHFDRSFIARHMPALDAVLHYRMVDVSAIRECYMRWVEPGFSNRWKIQSGEPKHRVADDIQSSIHQLRFFKQRCFR